MAAAATAPAPVPPQDWFTKTAGITEVELRQRISSGRGEIPITLEADGQSRDRMIRPLRPFNIAFQVA